MWRYRGLGPRPEPRYFRGSVQVYRDHVQSWLARHLGLRYDAEETWRAAISCLIHEPGMTLGEPCVNGSNGLGLSGRPQIDASGSAADLRVT